MARSASFLAKTLKGLLGVLREQLVTEEYASRGGLLQRLDARFKTAGLVLLLAAVLASRSIPVLASLYLMTVLLASVSAIGPWHFLARTWLFVPIFTLFVALPALFHPVTPGEALLPWHPFGKDLSITRPGAHSALLFFLRVLCSVSLTTLLLLTTGQQVLLRVMRVFRVPALFVMILGMCWRYIELLLDMALGLFTAVRSRVGVVKRSAEGRRLVGSSLAGLWLKSYRMQAQVYDAMRSRGYMGEPKLLHDFKARFVDVLALVISISIFAGTLWLNRYSN